jgi:F-box domain
MPSIPVDVLREILEHVGRADLARLCLVNKICYFYATDVLYRKIFNPGERGIETLAQSIDLARRVRSFTCANVYPGLATALQNMSSLRSLNLDFIDDASIVDGCTFKLNSFTGSFDDGESLRKFLNNQSSLIDVTLYTQSYSSEPSPFEETWLPSLTRVTAFPCWLSVLIPSRPVREVAMAKTYNEDPIDFSFFALSTAPIQKLYIPYAHLHPRRGSFLGSIFPSLVHLVVSIHSVNWPVCGSPFLIEEC